MKGIFVNCPECKKPLFRNAYLRPGSFLTCKCFYCGIQILLNAEPGKVILKKLTEPVEKLPLPDDEDDDIMMLST